MWKRGTHFLALPLALILLLYVRNPAPISSLVAAGRGPSNLLGNEKWCEVSPLLEQILVIITYHWDVTKFIYLTTVLDTIRTYETKIDVLIVTDNGKGLMRILKKWGHVTDSNFRLQIWQAPAMNDAQTFSLLWTHRQAVQEQLERHPDYTSIIYMEDDTRLSWPAVVSWALDTEVLAPLNFTRCIYRSEVDTKTGGANMLDWSRSVQLNNNNTLNMSLNPDYAREHGRLRNSPRCRCAKHRDGTCWPCQVHDHFFAPVDPFQGMWMATRAQFAVFMAQPYWMKEVALNATLVLVMGYPEHSTFMNLAIDVPAGFPSSCMIPFVLSESKGGELRPTLPVVAEVEHMRNGYTSIPNIHLARLRTEDALQTS